MNILTNSTDIKRRALFGMIPAAAALTATSAQALKMPDAPAHDPIPGWFEEWKRRTKVWKDAVDTDQEDATFEERCEIERMICTTKPVTREGAIAQLQYAIEDLGEYITGNLWEDLDTKLFQNLLSGLRGMA